jgi:multidrug efflux system membrane fusion protein
VIPTAAVQRGPNGAFVYVVSNDNKAVMHPIIVRKQDETQTVIASGVNPGERVVTTGFVQLTDGKPVTIGSDTPAAAPEQGQRPRGNGERRPPGNGERRQRGDGGGRRAPAASQ